MNKLVKRFNETLCEALIKLTNGNQNWDKLILSVLFAYRTRKPKIDKNRTLVNEQLGR